MRFLRHLRLPLACRYIQRQGLSGLMDVHTWEGALCQRLPFPASPYKVLCLFPLSNEHPWSSMFIVFISSTLSVRVLIDQASRTCFGVSTSPRVTALTMYCAMNHVSLLTRAEGSCLVRSVHRDGEPMVVY